MIFSLIIGGDSEYMFDIVLMEPEIPPNTGNIMRLSVNLGTTLHLIKPLGFSLEDKLLRRAGLDYREWADVKIHNSWQDFLQQPSANQRRIFAISTKGKYLYTDVQYQPQDIFVFGAETRGLPAWLLQSAEIQEILRIPMVLGNRSLNLSNSAAVVLYEAWRQQGFENGA